MRSSFHESDACCSRIILVCQLFSYSFQLLSIYRSKARHQKKQRKASHESVRESWEAEGRAQSRSLGAKEAADGLPEAATVAVLAPEVEPVAKVAVEHERCRVDEGDGAGQAGELEL